MPRRRRAPPAVISASSAPTLTVSPSAAWILTIVPETGEGTSASTLSVEISTSVSSAATLSPTCLCHSRTVPSETESPIAGITTSIVPVSTAIPGLHSNGLPGLRSPAVGDHDKADRAGERAQPAEDRDRHRQPERDHAPRAAAMQTSDITIQITPWASPSTNVSRLRVAEHERAHQQRQVDGGVGERRRLEAAEGDDALTTAADSSAASPPERLIGLLGPALGIGRPPGELVVLGVRRDHGAVGQPGHPDQHRDPVGQPDQRLDASAAPGPPTIPRCSSRASVSAGFSPTSTDPPAPSAQRSAQVASQARAPAGQPAAVGGADHAQRRQALHRVVGQQSQRPPGRLALERQAPVRGVEAAQPGRQPVVAGRAPPAQLGQRAVGLPRRPRRRLERLVAPGDLDVRRAATGRGPGCRARRPSLHRTRAAAGGARPARRDRLARCTARRKHWGWGYEHEQPSPAELRDAAAFLAGHLGFGSASPSRRWRCRRSRCPAPRLSPPPRAGRDLPAGSTTSGRGTPTAAPIATSCAASGAQFEHPPDVVAPPARRGGADRGARVGAGRRRGRDPVRRRHQRRRRRRARRRPTRFTGVVTIDLRALDRVLEVDPVSLSARIQAGATRPAAGGAAARARPDPAPLPAVIPVRHARRDDRHPRRRPLRHPLHPHRRPGGVGPGADPGGRVGVPAAAGLRRRRLARPDADRLRGHARRDHRGLGAGPRRGRGSRARPAVRFADFTAGARARCERCRSPGCTPPTAG